MKLQRRRVGAVDVQLACVYKAGRFRFQISTLRTLFKITRQPALYEKSKDLKQFLTLTKKSISEYRHTTVGLINTQISITGLKDTQAPT